MEKDVYQKKKVQCVKKFRSISSVMYTRTVRVNIFNL